MPSPVQLESFAKEIALRFKINAEHTDALANFVRESTDQFSPKPAN